MASYVAMEPPGESDVVVENTVFVRDGFSFVAFVVPLFWFLWHRMWIEAVLAVIAMLALAGLRSLEAFSNLAWIISLLSSFLIGLEASALRLWSLRRRGWRMWGVVEANGWKDAEARYVCERVEWGDTEREPYSQSRPVIVPGSVRSVRGGPALGLFDYPRTR